MISTRVNFLAHGTTVVINALTERKGVKVGLITTEGFRDTLEIARGNRPDFFNLHYEKPPPFVPRYLRRELPGRMTYQGEEMRPLILDGLADIINDFKDEGVEAIAISYLHSYANPSHEPGNEVTGDHGNDDRYQGEEPLAELVNDDSRDKHRSGEQRVPCGAEIGRIGAAEGQAERQRQEVYADQQDTQSGNQRGKQEPQVFDDIPGKDQEQACRQRAAEDGAQPDVPAYGDGNADVGKIGAED